MSSESESTASSTDYSEQRSTGVSSRNLLLASLSGFLGILAMQPIFGLATLIGAIDPIAFSGIANIVGYGLDFWGGVVLFFAAGMTVLPLLFVTLGNYLPPSSSIPFRGITFGTIMWSGFVIAFYTGQSGLNFVLYLLLTLVNHWIYGFVLGAVYTRFSEIAVYEV